MRLALVLAPWLPTQLPAVAADELRVAGKAFTLPDVKRETLGYCPPIQDAFIDYSCIADQPENGNIRFLMNRVEEGMWAVAEGREAGWLEGEKADGVLPFLESEMLLLCWLHLDCAFIGAEARNYWVSQYIQRCKEMQLRAPPMKQVVSLEDLCLDWDLQTALIERVHEYLDHEQRHSQKVVKAHAWLPKDVSPVCEGRGVDAVTWPMMTWSRLTGRHGTYALSMDARPLGKVIGYLVDRDVPAFVVNLGASNGACLDQGIFVDVANCAFSQGAHGLAVEGRRGQRLEGRWPGVQAYGGYVTPRNVSQIIEEALRTKGTDVIDLLKIDLDHADCVFAEEVLRSLPSPGIIHAEYSRALPPPIRLRERFSEGVLGRFQQVDDSWEVFASRRHWGGCSMQVWYDLLAPLGYELLQVDFNDLTFVRAELLDELGLPPPPKRDLFDRWLDAVHCLAPGRHLHGLQFHARFDLRALAEAGPEDRCRLATAWWAHEDAGETADLWC